MDESARGQATAASPLEVLIAEDEPDILDSLRDLVRDLGHRVTTARNGAQAMSLLDRRAFDLTILDIRLPKVDGMTLFRRIRRDRPDSQVILMSAYGTVSDAVNAMKEHAAHYLSKPFDLEELATLVDGVARDKRIRDMLAGAEASRPATNGLVGASRVMLRLRERIAVIARSDAAVVITGESGTGKELVARSIHGQSARRDRPFVAVNCAAFPETLLEAELFGHERGAFTGAVGKREGRFQAAHGGTMFLDEVADMAPTAQAKLLRVLEDGSYQPLGSDATVKVDVRIVSATNADLPARIAAGRFREDIFHRLKVFHVRVPPLRERLEDLPIKHFYRELCPDRQEGLNLSPAAWTALRGHRFPGNVRELRNALEHALVLAGKGEIRTNHLPQDICSATQPPPDSRPELQMLGSAVEDFERHFIHRTLELCDWQRAKTAQVLGISRKTLWQKMRQYGLTDDEPEPPDTDVP
jgi:DNA-binding NtrC family response regulator